MKQFTIILILVLALFVAAPPVTAGTLYSITYDSQLETRCTLDATVLSSFTLGAQPIFLLPDTANNLLYGIFNTYPTTSIGLINPVDGDITGLVTLGAGVNYFSFDGTGERGVELFEERPQHERRPPRTIPTAPRPTSPSSRNPGNRTTTSAMPSTTPTAASPAS